MQRRQQVLDRPDGMALAAKRGVVTGLADVFDTGRNRRLSSQRGKAYPASGWRWMQNDPAFKARMQPVASKHKRARNGPLSNRPWRDPPQPSISGFLTNRNLRRRTWSVGVPVQHLLQRCQQATD